MTANDILYFLGHLGCLPSFLSFPFSCCLSPRFLEALSGGRCWEFPALLIHLSQPCLA